MDEFINEFVDIREEAPDGTEFTYEEKLTPEERQEAGRRLELMCLEFAEWARKAGENDPGAKKHLANHVDGYWGQLVFGKEVKNFQQLIFWD